jgi:hypothetical protein
MLARTVVVRTPGPVMTDRAAGVPRCRCVHRPAERRNPLMPRGGLSSQMFTAPEGHVRTATATATAAASSTCTRPLTSESATGSRAWALPAINPPRVYQVRGPYNSP